MARQEKPEDPGPSKLYLLSFGDTMTTLLAFFIILCSMADDQSGANLYSGTGSFVNAFDGAGGAGKFSTATSNRAVDLEHASPRYPVPGEDGESGNPATGPDDDNGLRSIDREKEEMQRFLNEIERLADVDKEAETVGEVTFDFFKRLNEEAPVIPPTYNSMLAQVVPVLRANTHRVEVIVWAKNPGPFAVRIATNQSSAVATELVERVGLNDEQQSRLRAVGKPWRFSDHKRPILSVVIRKVEERKSA